MSATPSFSPSDRLKSALAGLIAEMLPDIMFRGVFEYAVTAQNGQKIDADPVNPNIGLPHVAGAPMRPLLGGEVQYANGAKLLVAFIDADPTRPYVIGGDPDTEPTNLAILGGDLAVARVGDQVQSTLDPALICQGTINGSEAFVGTITVTNPITGVITGPGSQTVNCT